jgi:hypothetical protein
VAVRGADENCVMPRVAVVVLTGPDHERLFAWLLDGEGLGGPDHGWHRGYRVVGRVLDLPVLLQPVPWGEI